MSVAVVLDPAEVATGVERIDSDCLRVEALEEDVKKEGLMEYGCAHYRRRCLIRAPCCNGIFSCRHCHNEAMNVNEPELSKRHDLPRHNVRSVICSLCGLEQPVQQLCSGCGVSMGEYFCSVCNFFDDDVSKGQFHCASCGICRVGGRENFFHCDKCGCCYSLQLRSSGHSCVEKAMHHNCPVCFEYLFDSVEGTCVLRCGHTIHSGCLKEMVEHRQFSCPVCSRSVCDMTQMWARMDLEIEMMPMPETYRGKMVWILCNDCGRSSEVSFHIVGHKCLHCASYNTRQTRSPPPSSASSSSSSLDYSSSAPSPVRD